MQPQAPWDSPAVHGKIYTIEYDLRTHLTPKGSPAIYDFLQTAEQTADLLLHDFCSAAIRGHALYVLDGKANSFVTMEANETGTAAIWSAVGTALRTAGQFVPPAAQKEQREDGSIGGGLPAEVAVFVDDVSTAHWPVNLAGRSNKHMPPFHDLDWGSLNLGMVPETFGALPFPVRHHLLSDILAPEFSAAAIKLAVLLNPVKVSAELAAAIKAKLQVGNKTVLYSVAAAALDGDGAATFTDGARDLTGMQGLALGTGSPLGRRTVFTDPGKDKPGWPAAAAAIWAPLVGSAAGTHWQATPWWWYNASQAGPDETGLVLGRYETTTRPSLVQVAFADHTSVFSANPALPAAAIQALAAAAGVHSYTPL